MESWPGQDIQSIHMPEIKITIQAEWYWLCLIFEQMYRPSVAARTIGKPRIQYIIPDVQGLTGQQPPITKTVEEILELSINHSRLIISMPDQGVYGSVSVTFTGLLDKVTLTAEYDDPRDEEYTKRILGILHGAAQQAKKYKDEGERIKAEQLIQHYYDLKQAGEHVTFAQLAKSYGYNESYLRQAHLKYKREQSQPIPNKKPNNGRTKRGKGT